MNPDHRAAHDDPQATGPVPSGVQFVTDFHQLATTPFTEDLNALCWRRNLPGDFADIVACLGAHRDPVTTLDAAVLHALPLSAQGRIAADIMLADLHLLSGRDLAPVLNCVYAYPRDERAGPITTDVFSFHIDSAPCPTDTWLCTYHGPGSEGLWNADARRHVDLPDTRAALRAAYGGGDDAGFREFLRDNAYDLHFAALPHARPYRFGVGHLWRIATRHPGSVAPPCIHRAPPPAAGDPPRLLLIS